MALSTQRTLQACQSYNIVLTGNSRVGKSTFITLLQQHSTSRTGGNPYRGTKLPELQTLYCGFDTHSVLNVLDTPGLDEVAENGVSRSDNELKDIICTHIKDNFTSLNLILITIQHGGITDKVISTIYGIKDHFGNKYLDSMCLLVTHCDAFSESDEKEYITQLKANPVMKSFVTAIKDRIIFTGTSQEKVKDGYDFIANQERRRAAFLDYVSKSSKIPLKNMSKLTDIRPIDILESAATTNDIILNFSEQNEITSGQALQKLDLLKKLTLNEADGKRRDALVAAGASFLEKNPIVRSTDDERNDAKRYNEVEIPLKSKAVLLKGNHFRLTTQLNLLDNNYQQLKLKELTTKEAQTPVVEEGGFAVLEEDE